MTTIKELEKDALRAAGEAGAEYEYLNAFIKNLLGAEYDLEHNPKKEVRDIESARSLVRRNLGRTERYLGRDTDRVEKEMQELAGYLPGVLLQKLSKIHEELKVPLNALKEALSRQQGSFAEDLEKLEARAQLLDDKLKELNLARGKPAVVQELTRETKALEGEVLVGANALVVKARELIKWIQGLEVSFKNYQTFLKYLEEL